MSTMRTRIMGSSAAQKSSLPNSESDDFASVLHPSPSSSSSASSASSSLHSSPHLGPSSTTQLTDQQLYDRIEEQLEQLDKKRLTLMQLVRLGGGGREQALRSYRETPYSSRIARSLESTRADSTRLAKKIHNLFKYVHTVAPTTAATTVAPSPSSSAGAATVSKFTPLLTNYAAVSQLLHNVCLESLAFEEEIASKKSTNTTPSGGRGSPMMTDLTRKTSADVAKRKRREAAQLRESQQQQLESDDSDTGGLPSSSSYASTSSPFESPYLSAIPSSQPQQLLLDDLPSLQVNGLEKKHGDYMHLQGMVVDIAESFKTLQGITAEQQRMLDEAQANVTSANAATLAGESELRKASRYKAYGLVLAGGVTGAAIGGPIGAIVGLKTGLSIGLGVGLLGVGGAVIGAAAGKTIQKARFVPLSHEPNQEEQELALLNEKRDDIKKREAEIAASQPKKTERICSRTC